MSTIPAFEKIHKDIRDRNHAMDIAKNTEEIDLTVNV